MLPGPPSSRRPTSEAFYESLVDALPQQIVQKDLSGRFIFANSRFCERVGRAVEDLIGLTDFDLFPADVAARYRSDDERALASGGPVETVRSYDTSSGVRHVQAVKSPLRDASGTVVGVQAIIWDITDLKRLEDELHLERELLRALLDASPDDVYFKDRESRFIKVSRSLPRRLGRATAEEAIGRSDADYFDPEHADAARRDEQQIMETGQPIVAKAEHEKTPDGQYRWVLTTKAPLRDRTGTIIGTLGITRDISELKRAEADLAVARDAALESARLKSEFLANMSHEIRTPLNAIVGMSGLLLETELDPEQRDFAGTIRSSADLLLGIINDILDFSKIEAGKMLIESIDFTLDSVIEDTADLLAESAQSRGLELATWVPPHVPRALRGDPSRIRQVLANLVSNAVKFTERGEVVVQVGLAREDVETAVLHFQVRDTGVGIPVEAQSRLFNAFTQADGSTTRRYGGTGLGLAICRQLVTLMGGTIGFDSMPGRGSTFWFTLPLGKQAQPAVRAPRRSLDGLHVLIVDDNETNREILRHQLAGWKMRSRSASNGPDALTVLRRQMDNGDPVQAVILDMQMPDMDGLAVARAIAADPSLSPTRVIILTSLAHHPHEIDLRTAGIQAYLTKPVKQSRLFDCLADVMSDPAEVAEPAARRTWQPRLQSPGGGPRLMRVLLAEDNPVNQKVALRQLAKLGVTADAVGTGTEVLTAIRQAPYDAILMDCQMPELDGYEATRRIRRWEQGHPAARPQYIVAVTAHALDGDRERCLDSGMDDYLSKPIRLEDLARALERCQMRLELSSDR
jgi:PAS domain S-box-containing protein